MCAHAEGTRRALAEHTSPTRLPRSRGILPFRMPASGRWHPHCHSSRSRSLLATAATVQLPDPKGKWPGRAGSSGGRRWKRWPKPRFDLSPISRGRSPPSLRGQLGSFLSTTLEQPSVCGNSPEAVQNKVRFRCFSPPGIAWPRQSLLPAPQFPPLCTEKLVPKHKQTWCFTHGNELRNSRSAQVQLWSPKSNSSAGVKGSRAGAGAQNSSHKGELSKHRQRKAVSSPPLLPTFVECFFNRDAESSDSSKFLELRLLPANSPVTLSTFGCKQTQMFTSGSPRAGGAVQASGLASPNPP